MIRSKQIQRPMQVLVVDDQEINRDALEAILEDDYGILTAGNGQEALDMMRTHTADLSLVLLDLIMPVMSGLEVLEIVRKASSVNLKGARIIVCGGAGVGSKDEGQSGLILNNRLNLSVFKIKNIAYEIYCTQQIKAFAYFYVMANC